jgi:predicted RNA-binding Zn-ribbon protein involved in translation (DUF1610 family)
MVDLRHRSTNWTCPECGHALVAYYSRPWRLAFRKAIWRGCVSCDFRERYTSTRLVRTVDWPTFWVGVALMVLVMAVAVYGFWRAGAW